MVRIAFRATLALLVLLMAAPPAHAQFEQLTKEGAFCYAVGRTALAELVCEDAELTRLHVLIGEADPTAGTSWLSVKATTCGLAVDAKRVSLEDRWRIAPCLAAEQRRRLAELGLPQPEVAFAKSPAPSGFVHPLCLWELANHQKAVPRHACDTGYRHIPVKIDEGALSAEAPYNHGTTNIHARWLGSSPTGADVYLLDQGDDREKIGGTMVVSFFTWPGWGGEDTLNAQLVEEGQYNCQEGISDASVIPGKGISVTTWADSEWSGLAKLPRLNAGSPYRCLAKVTRLHPFDGGTPRMTAVEIQSIADWDLDGFPGDPANQCVAKLIRQATASNPVLSPSQWEKFAATLRRCE